MKKKQVFAQIPTARQILANGGILPHEVRLLPLKSHQDARGALCEVFRNDWSLGGPSPVQWNLVQSEPNVLRGVHIHQIHWDYLLVISSEMILGLQDLRRSSPSYNLAVSVRLQSDDLHSVVIPPGVAHGFYFPRRATFLYSVSQYFDPGDELGCRWDDPAVLVRWPCEDPILSERDLTAGSLADMMTKLES